MYKLESYSITPEQPRFSGTIGEMGRSLNYVAHLSEKVEVSAWGDGIQRVVRSFITLTYNDNDNEQHSSRISYRR